MKKKEPAGLSASSHADYLFMLLLIASLQNEASLDCSLDYHERIVFFTFPFTTGVTGDRLVGHQTRLESKGTVNCPLIFCTTGVFLRSLIENDRCLKGITHVIIDQVHERDRFTDLLLGVFRLRLSQYPDLRLILLSADMAPHALGNYFHQEKIIRVPVSSNPVSQLFLEDILTCTKFLSKQKLLTGAGGVKGELTLGPATVFDELITEVSYYLNILSTFLIITVFCLFSTRLGTMVPT